MSKFEIAISTLFIGFILGQATDLIKYRWQISRKKKALKSEVQDVQRDFSEKGDRLEVVVRDMSELHIGVPVPGSVSTLIFQEYYAEVAPHLSSDERKSILQIYDHVSHYNQERDKGDRSTFESAKKSLFLMYSQCLFGHASAKFYLENNGKELFLSEKNQIIAINEQIDKFAQEVGIAS